MISDLDKTCPFGVPSSNQPGHLATAAFVGWIRPVGHTRTRQKSIPGNNLGSVCGPELGRQAPELGRKDVARYQR
jgi:hypothetical protein